MTNEKQIEQHYLCQSLDNDLIAYMSGKQMYVTKEIVNTNFKTQFSADTVYFIDKIEIVWLYENSVYFIIISQDTECQFCRTCNSKEDFYNEIKSLFIPVKDLFEAWKKLNSNQ